MLQLKNKSEDFMIRTTWDWQTIDINQARQNSREFSKQLKQTLIDLGYDTWLGKRMIKRSLYSFYELDNINQISKQQFYQQGKLPYLLCKHLQDDFFELICDILLKVSTEMAINLTPLEQVEDDFKSMYSYYSPLKFVFNEKFFRTKNGKTLKKIVDINVGKDIEQIQQKCAELFENETHGYNNKSIDINMIDINNIY